MNQSQLIEYLENAGNEVDLTRSESGEIDKLIQALECDNEKILNTKIKLSYKELIKMGTGEGFKTWEFKGELRLLNVFHEIDQYARLLIMDQAKIWHRQSGYSDFSLNFSTGGNGNYSSFALIINGDENE